MTDEERARAFVDVQRWLFAKTMADFPFVYCRITGMFIHYRDMLMEGITGKIYRVVLESRCIYY